MACKICAKFKGGDRRKEVLVSQILYLPSDATGVFFGKTTKNTDYPTSQSIKHVRGSSNLTTYFQRAEESWWRT